METPLIHRQMKPGTGANAMSMSWIAPLAILVTALVIGLLVGISDPTNLLIMFGTVLALVACAVWPLHGTLVTMAVMFEALPINAFVSFGSFKPHELLIGYLAMVVFVRAMFAGKSLLAPLEEFKWPLLFITFCILMSCIYGYYFAQNQFILGELRSFTTWLLIPIIMLSVDNAADRKTLVRGMIAIAVAMSILVIIQSLFNIKLVNEGRVEMLDNEGNSDVTRAIAGGAVYLMVFTLYRMIMMPDKDKWPKWLRIATVMLMLLGLAVTFGRGVWISSVVGLCLATFIVRGVKGVVSTLLLGSLVLTVVLAATSLYNPRLAEAIVERATGVGQELESGGSFGWRGLENKAALLILREKPWTGVGIGGEYKKTISSQGNFPFETFYIHNAYVGYAVKMGVQAALFPPMMILCFMLAARRIYRSSGAGERLTVAALCGTFAVPVIASYTQPEWMSDQGIGAFCLLISLLLVMGKTGSAPVAPPERPKLRRTFS